MLKRIIIPAALAAVATLSVAGATAASAATPHPASHHVKAAAAISATTAISNHPDSGAQGNDWALDTFSRTATVKLVGEVAASNCPGTDTGHCYLWNFALADSGHFTSIAGQDAPRTGTLDRQLTGTMSGGAPTGQFYSSWKTAKASRVPASQNDQGVSPTGRKTTTNWVEQFFGAGAVFNSAANPGGPDLGSQWSWTYTLNFGTNSQCPNDAWRWVDANANGGGSQNTAGNILTPDTADCS